MIDTDKIAGAMLKPLIAFAQKNRGTTKDLADRLTAKLGKTIHRQVVVGYLNPDTSKRNTPNLGLGLLIFDEGQKMMKQPREIDLRKLIGKGRA